MVISGIIYKILLIFSSKIIKAYITPYECVHSFCDVDLYSIILVIGFAPIREDLWLRPQSLHTPIVFSVNNVSCTSFSI